MSEQIKFNLKIYLVGVTPENQDMILGFQDQLNEKFGNDTYRLEVIDVLEQPELAEADKILATPTIIRSLPAPIKKFILDLNDASSRLVALDLISEDSE